MRIIDLFSGLEGFSTPFRDRNHEVVTVDIDSRFKPDVVADVRKLKLPCLAPLDKPFDVILASPPCEQFSVASFSAGFPRDGSIEAIGLVASTLRIISEARPTWWIMENPRGLLRKIIGPPTGTVTLCQYGDSRMKPTDLWGRLPSGFRFKSCKNGATCHERAPRGSRTGTQGLKSPALRSKLPYGLGEELCKKMEKEK